jgi:hypothetical protein
MLGRAHVGELIRIQILVSNFIGGSFSAFWELKKLVRPSSEWSMV